MSECPEGEFKCKSSPHVGGHPPLGLGHNQSHGGKCILLRYRCDGDNDCGDWSDEEGCPARMSSCPATEFKCGDGICIPGQWRCDREPDCDSGEDEADCDALDGGTKHLMGSSSKSGAVPAPFGGCTEEEFACTDGKCIMRSWLCDGTADCRNAEDELQECGRACDVGHFECPRNESVSASAA